MAALPELLAALKVKTGFEPVQQAEVGGKAYLHGRIRGQTIANMLVVTHRLLLQARTATWNIDVSQVYSLKNGQLVKGWRIVVDSNDMGSALDQIVQIVRGAPEAVRPTQLEEFPLAVSTADRNAPNARGKGAALTGQAIVGRR
jgi:hypothetical protein